MPTLVLDASWTTGGSIVCLLEDGRNSQGHKLFCTSEMLTRCQLADASVVGLLTLLLKLPGQTITMWCDNNYCNQLPVHPHYEQQKPTRAWTFLLTRYMIQSNLPSHFFPCISVMMMYATIYLSDSRTLLLMLTFVGISHHKLV